MFWTQYSKLITQGKALLMCSAARHYSATSKYSQTPPHTQSTQHTTLQHTGSQLSRYLLAVRTAVRVDATSPLRTAALHAPVPQGMPQWLSRAL